MTYVVTIEQAVDTWDEVQAYISVAKEDLGYDRIVIEVPSD